MLEKWQSDLEYRTAVSILLEDLHHSEKQPLKHQLKGIMKVMLRLELDPVFEYMSSLYPPMGRPSNKQPTIIRSLVLKELLASKGIVVVGLTKWVEVLRHLYTLH